MSYTNRWTPILNKLTHIFAALVVAVFQSFAPPKIARAATVTKCGNITTNETWTADNVYVLTCNVWTNTGVTLTIQAGTVVKFTDNTGLFVNGIFDVQGSPTNLVVFTSYLDDQFGGDTNGDGSASAPSYSNWGSISLNSSSIATLQYARIRYGGNSSSNGAVSNASSLSVAINNNILEYDYIGIASFSGNPSITYNQVLYSRSDGISISGGSPTLDHNTITGSEERGIYYSNAAGTISNNTLSANLYGGLIFDGASPVVTNNTINDGNLSWGFMLGLWNKANPSLSGNIFNGRQVVDVKGVISSNVTWGNIQGSKWVYYLSGDVTVDSGASLTIPAGTVIKGGSLIVNGILDAQGSSANPVVFTSYRDDQYGGDSNGDGAASTPAPGDLGCIVLNNSGVTLQYTHIRYGGGCTWSGAVRNYSSAVIQNNIFEYTKIGIVSTSGNPSITSNQILYSQGYGILIEGGGPIIDHNTITGSGSWGIYYGGAAGTVSNNLLSANHDGMVFYAASPLVSNNTIADSTNFTLGLDSGATPDFNGNIFSGPQVVEVSGMISSDVTWGKIQGSSWTYWLTSVIVNNGASLTISPGTVVKFADYYADLTINGALNAQGDPAHPIIFTSYRDDQYGGDTNKDGATTVPHPGDWVSIRFNGAAQQSVLQYVMLRYGGYNTNPMVYIDHAAVSIQNTLFEYSGSKALQIVYISGDPAITVQYCTFRQNMGSGIYVTQ